MDHVRISGAGVLSPFGVGFETFKDGLYEGRAAFRTSGERGGVVAAPLPLEPKKVLRRKGLTALSRAALLAAGAIEDLLAGLKPPVSPEELAGAALVLGTAFGNLESKARFHRGALEDGPALVSPIVFPNTLINAPAGHAAILFGIRGPNITVDTGRRAGLEALLRAAALLAEGRASIAIAAAVDELSPILVEGLRAQGRLRASLDPSGGGEGIVPGEAGVALLLRGPHGAKGSDLLELRGWGEGYAVRNSLAGAVERALRGALEMAGAAASDVRALALSTSGETGLDAAEWNAVRAVFGPSPPPHWSPKALAGETFAPSSLLGVLSLAAFLERGVPPSAGAAPACTAAPGEEDAARKTGPVVATAVDRDGALAVLLSPPGNRG